MPPVVQDQLIPTNTNINFPTFHNETNGEHINRILHNGVDIIKGSFYDNEDGQAVAPRIRYFQTNGEEKVSYPLSSTGVLDVYYDQANAKFYSVRTFASVSGTTITGTPASDSFSEDTGSNFNPNRWTPSGGDSFVRSPVNNNFFFNTATSGYGQLINLYTLSGDFFDLELDYNINVLAGAKQTKFSLIASNVYHSEVINPDTVYPDILSYYEVGLTYSGSSLAFNTKIYDFENSTQAGKIYEFYTGLPKYIHPGLQEWLIFKQGSNFIVSGSVVGQVYSGSSQGFNLLTHTGAGYYLSLDSGFTSGDFMRFTMDYSEAPGSSTGTLHIHKALDEFSSDLDASFTTTLDSISTYNFEIVGQTDIAVELTADNFVCSGTINNVSGVNYYYQHFAVDRINLDGTLHSNLISDFDCITDYNLTYNDLSRGNVQIAVSPAEMLYLKVFDDLYAVPVSSPVTGTITPTSTGIFVGSGIIVATGTNSLAYNTSAGGFLQYATYESITSEVKLNTINASLPPTSSDRRVFLYIPDWNQYISDGAFKLWLHQPDNGSIFYLKKNGDLYQFNIDTDISAFSAVNVDDYSLQAGTGDVATVTVSVINAWGDPLNGKNVNFQIISGDGVINPPSAVTSGDGEAAVQYTAGIAVGTAQIQTTISD